MNAPTIFVIFGATGDLMRRKLVPALFHLYSKKQLPEMVRVVAFSRRSFSKEEFGAYVHDFLGEHAKNNREDIQRFLSYVHYQQGNFEDAESYAALSAKLQSIDEEWGMCSNKLFYLAVPPQFYKTILLNLSDSKLTLPCSDETGWTRVLVEKPFGRDLESAQELDALLGKLFDEKQIFRIDHFLAKEAVQNILAFRFSNSVFESSWNSRTIEKVEITVREEGGIEGRGAFYDGVGALRDVGQNHLLQMLALVAMERPASFAPGLIREARARVFQSLRPMKGLVEEYTARGQYEGYKEEPHVAKDSQTETYFRIIAHIDTERWRGVPFHLESGKRLGSGGAEIIITFRHAEPCLCPPGEHFKNTLYFQLQPNQEIIVSLLAKRPGHKLLLEEKSLAFNYKHAFAGEDFLEAYEKILLDCIEGDQTLFASTSEIMASWKYIDEIIAGWKNGETPLVTY